MNGMDLIQISIHTIILAFNSKIIILVSIKIMGYRIWILITLMILNGEFIYKNIFSIIMKQFIKMLCF